jgi:drug/metabolite transporter (DMT)-like permease
MAMETGSHPGMQRTASALFLMALSIFLQAVMGACVKLLGESYPAVELVFARNLFALLPLALLLRTDGVASLRTSNWSGHAMRAVVGLLATAAFFISLRMLPFAEAVILGFASPLFTALLSWPMLRERVTTEAWLAIVIGFAGVVISLPPGTWHASLGAAIALAGAACLAINRITIRQLSGTESSTAITVHFTVICTLLTAICLPFDYRIPTYHDAMVMVAIGVAGGVSQFCLTVAHCRATPALVGPLQYTSLVWAALFGMIFWGEMPTVNGLLGAALVIFSGLLLLNPPWIATLRLRPARWSRN